MTVAIAFGGLTRQRHTGSLAIDVPAVLAFIAFSGLVLAPRIGSLSAAIFLLAGGGLILSNLRHSTRALLDHWYAVLPLALYCLASTLWSQFPEQTLKASLQLAATLAIAVAVATRVPPATLLRALFWLLLLALVASGLLGRVRDDTGAWVGIFGSKNAFAAVVSLFALTAIASLADGRASWLIRGTALAGLALAAPMLVLAQSAGALLTLVPAVGVCVLVLASGLLSLRQKTIAAIALAFAAAAGAAILAGYWDDILRLVLVTTGKDATLTGRTELWETAGRLIAEHPFTGVGYRAFWVQGNPPAEMLWSQFGIAARAGFGFHNAYLATAVDLGLVGASISVATLVAATTAVMRWSFRAPGVVPAFFAGYLTLLIGGSFVETAFFYEFSLPTILIICALIYSLRAAPR